MSESKIEILKQDLLWLIEQAKSNISWEKQEGTSEDSYVHTLSKTLNNIKKKYNFEELRKCQNRK